MKLPLIPSAALALLVLLAGCSGGEEPEEAATEGEEPAEASSEDDGAAGEEKDPEDAPAAEDAGPQAPGDVTWGSAATEFRGEDGAIYEYECPAGGSEDDAGIVWGTDVYTDDSSVCGAAVHAGLITFEDGGLVRFEIAPGEEEYEGTERNGFETSDWGSWSGSFVFSDSDEPATATY